MQDSITFDLPEGWRMDADYLHSTPPERVVLSVVDADGDYMSVPLSREQIATLRDWLTATLDDALTHANESARTYRDMRTSATVYTPEWDIDTYSLYRVNSGVGTATFTTYAAAARYAERTRRECSTWASVEPIA